MPSLEPPTADRTDIPVQLLPFCGCKIMVVEDEFVIADDLAALLRGAGAEVIGHVASLPEAMRLAAQTGRIDAAVLNIDLNGVTVFPLADELIARGVRFMFLTGYGRDNIPAEYAAIHCCKKPTGPATVIDEMKALLRPIAA